MRYLWTLVKKATDVFCPQTWHNSVATRIDVWFGALFWVGAAVVILVFPAAQVWALCEVRLPVSVRGIIAIIDFLAAVILFSMAWGVTLYGTHSLAGPMVFQDLVYGVWPQEYKKVGTAAVLYRNPNVMASQKENVVEELTRAPYPFRIFAKYVMRVVFVVVAFSLYLGLLLLLSKMVPHQHLVNDAGNGSAIHAFEILRDIQMEILGGTSTEHLPSTNVTIMASAGWEIALLVSTILYVMLISVLLPMQIGIVGNLDRQLKSKSFWRKQLKAWPEPKDLADIGS